MSRALDNILEYLGHSFKVVEGERCAETRFKLLLTCSLFIIRHEEISGSLLSQTKEVIRQSCRLLLVKEKRASFLRKLCL